MRELLFTPLASALRLRLLLTFFITYFGLNLCAQDTLGSFHFNTGTELRLNGLLDSAFVHFHLSQKHYALEGDTAGLLSAQMQLGIVSDLLGQRGEAKKHFRDALKLASNTSSLQELADGYMNLGGSFIYDDEVDSADLYLGLAESLYRDLKYEKGLSDVLNNRAVLNMNLGSDSLAIEKFRELYDIKLAIGDTAGMTAIEINLGTAFLNLDQFDSSQTYLLSGADLAIEANLPRYHSFALRNLGHLHYNFEKYQEAADYYEDYHDLKDDLFSAQTQTRIEELEVQYDVAQKDLDLAQSELEKSEQRQLFIIIGSVLAAGILLILLIYTRRVSLQRARTQAIIDAREKENKRIANMLWKELGQAVKEKKLILPGVEMPEQTISGAIEAAKYLTNQHFNPYLQVSFSHAVEHLVSTFNSGGANITLDTPHVTLEKKDRKAAYRIIENLLVDAVAKFPTEAIEVKITHNGSLDMEVKLPGELKRESVMYRAAEARVKQLKGKMTTSNSKLTASIPSV